MIPNVSQKLNLKALRESHGMSQMYLAEKLGMSRPTLIKVEKGERILTKPEEDRARELFGMVEEHMAGRSDMRVNVPQKKLEKFKQVFLYILEKTAGKPNIGMTALYKILYFIDFAFFKFNYPRVDLQLY